MSCGCHKYAKYKQANCCMTEEALDDRLYCFCDLDLLSKVMVNMLQNEVLSAALGIQNMKTSCCVTGEMFEDLYI